jgi:hypothetical protein
VHNSSKTIAMLISLLSMSACGGAKDAAEPVGETSADDDSCGGSKNAADLAVSPLVTSAQVLSVSALSQGTLTQAQRNQILALAKENCRVEVCTHEVASGRFDPLNITTLEDAFTMTDADLCTSTACPTRVRGFTLRTLAVNESVAWGISSAPAKRDWYEFTFADTTKGFIFRAGTTDLTARITDDGQVRCASGHLDP